MPNTEVAQVVAELELDALRTIICFCQEKSIGYGGWTEQEAIALACVEVMADKLERVAYPE